MTPQDRLAQINQTAQKLKTDFESFRSNEVPVEVMENPTPGLEIPQVEVDPGSTSQAVLAGQASAQQLETTQAQKASEKQESTIRSLSAQLGERAGERQELREEAGLPASEKELADMMTSIRSQTASLAEFDDETFLGEEVLRGEASKRDVTKASFGAQARERRLQRAIDRTGKAAALRVNIASAELLQNNITAAQAQIKEALDTKYSAIEQELQLELQFLNRAWQVADKKEQQSIDARQALVTQQLNDIKDAKDMVFNSMPYATPEEVQAMNDPNLSPSEQRDMAQKITARGLREDRDLELQAQRLNNALTSQRLSQLIAESASPATTEVAIGQMNEQRTSGSVRNVLASIMGTMDVPASQRTNIGIVFDVASSLENFAGANPEGEFIGMSPVPGFRGGGGLFDRMFKTEDYKERISNRSQIESINLKVQQWASGAALTDEQTKQVAKITPRIGDSDIEVKQKTNELYNYMLGITESQLVTSGINLQFPEIDLFEYGDLINGMSEEQLQEYDDILLETNTSTSAYGT